MKDRREKLKDFRKMFCRQSQEGPQDSTEDRIKKVESSISFLYGLFLGYFIVELLEAVFELV